jgi:hypothetical protein
MKMEHRKRLLALVLIALFCVSGCISGRTVRGSGNVIEEERTVGSFEEVGFGTVGSLIVELGDQERLLIEAEENLMEYIEVDIRGDTLEIGMTPGVVIVPTEGVHFYLTVVNLEGVSLSGLGSIELPDLEVTRFEINISGAGDIDLEELAATQLDVNISGLGNLTIEDGEVEEQEINISGGGDYNAGDLESARTEIFLSGLGSATVRVEEYLSVDISGAGSVEYYGSPSVDQNVSGVGHVENIGD